MASATVDSSSYADRPLLPDSIPTVDLRYLSQSELYALSLCSAAAFDPRSCDDVVIPKIDRSVFNESAGSRKQTYSRLRLAPAASAASICRRTPHLRSPKPSSVETNPERAENSQIVALLKGLFASETNGNDFAPIRVENSNPVPDYHNSIADLSDLSNPGNDGANNGMKRKRGRPRKDENAVVLAKIEIKDIFIYENVEKRDDNIVNSDLQGKDNVKKRKRGRPRKDGKAATVVPVKNKVKETAVYENVEESDKVVVNSKCVIVDVAALAGLEDPFGPEIRRRTEGMGRVDELLGFLEGLGGRWGSRRKKKKVVDASDFGDYLPKGWKISVSLKRKEGRVWLFCRRYISPSGRQFISCKEVSSYLLSIWGLQDKNQPSFPQGNENNQFECEMASRNAEDGLFRLNERYDRESCFEGPRSGRTEPVEFSFLTTQNLTSLQGDSKNFSYDAGMEQELDSSYWLGKHDLMPNMAARSQVTTLCVWCRNEFHHEPVHSGMQAEIGSLCPTCRARISEQVNVL